MEYYGHLALRIGYIKETGNTATIYATGKYTSSCTYSLHLGLGYCRRQSRPSMLRASCILISVACFTSTRSLKCRLKTTHLCSTSSIANLCDALHSYIHTYYEQNAKHCCSMISAVCGGQHLPSIRKVGTSDSCVSVTLVPCSMFAIRIVKTTTCKGTVNPTFQQTFQL